MQEHMNAPKRRLPIWPLIMAVLTLAVLAAFVVRRDTSRSKPVQVIMPPQPAPRPPMDAATVGRMMASMQTRLSELDGAYADALRQYGLARDKAIAAGRASTEALNRAVEDAKEAVNAAVERNPAVVAARQGMAQCNDLSTKLSNRQADLLTTMHASQKRQRQASEEATLDVYARMAKARDEYVTSVGAKDAAHLTPEQAERLGTIQTSFLEQAAALNAKQAEVQPDETQKRLIDDYRSLGQQRAASDARYSQCFKDLEAARLDARASDPTVMALDRALTEANARYLAALDRAPDLAGLQHRLQAIERERKDLAAQLRDLQSRCAATAPASGAPTNG